MDIEKRKKIPKMLLSLCFLRVFFLSLRLIMSIVMNSSKKKIMFLSIWKTNKFTFTIQIKKKTYKVSLSIDHVITFLLVNHTYITRTLTCLINIANIIIQNIKLNNTIMFPFLPSLFNNLCN